MYVCMCITEWGCSDPCAASMVWLCVLWCAYAVLPLCSTVPSNAEHTRMSPFSLSLSLSLWSWLTSSSQRHITTSWGTVFLLHLYCLIHPMCLWPSQRGSGWPGGTRPSCTNKVTWLHSEHYHWRCFLPSSKQVCYGVLSCSCLTVVFLVLSVERYCWGVNWSSPHLHNPRHITQYN